MEFWGKVYNSDFFRIACFRQAFSNHEFKRNAGAEGKPLGASMGFSLRPCNPTTLSAFPSTVQLREEKVTVMLHSNAG